MRTFPALALLLSLAAAPAATAAQDVLEEAKTQYAAAAYDEALAILSRANPSIPVNEVELEQYKAFCFIALGRMEDAERAVAALVAADPKYVPSPAVASPKVLSLVSEMRAKQLPAVARDLLESGRTAFTEKDMPRAQHDFALLLDLLEDPALKSRPESEDLRVVAQGFATLTTAVAATPPPAGADAPSPAAPAAPRFEPIEPPVAISQEMPLWRPPDAITEATEYSGAIRVVIGVDGRVKSAVMEQHAHPAYDSRLLYAARSWVFKPATRGGKPIEVEKLIPFKLRPREDD
jgi:hypothetical protein